MRLSDFLDADRERILQEWEPFAATLLPASSRLDSLALRDHAPEILAVIADDLRTPQSSAQQGLKSKGLAPRDAMSPHTAAETHAILRAGCGFTAQQLVSEYRALRATVLRLWLETVSSVDSEVVSDIGRFNEAVDQAVAESVDHFTREVDRWRSVFLGTLGHELRGPLNTVLFAAQIAEALPDKAQANEYIARVKRSGARMTHLLNELLDYNRGTLGRGISLSLSITNMASVCEEELDALRVSTPGASIVMKCYGNMVGLWDEERVRQVACNLITNAVKYGDRFSPVVVQLVGREDEVEMSVANAGPAIPTDQLDRLFEPLYRGPTRSANGQDHGLGLGLYIVKTIAAAHQAKLQVESANDRTVFTVTWPRRSQALEAGAA